MLDWMWIFEVLVYMAVTAWLVISIGYIYLDIHTTQEELDKWKDKVYIDRMDDLELLIDYMPIETVEIGRNEHR